MNVGGRSRLNPPVVLEAAPGVQSPGTGWAEEGAGASLGGKLMGQGEEADPDWAPDESPVVLTSPVAFWDDGTGRCEALGVLCCKPSVKDGLMLACCPWWGWGRG